MDSRATQDESGRLKRMMAELRDLPRSEAFKKLPVEEQKRIASALRDLATRVRTLKPQLPSTRALGKRGAFARELRPQDQRPKRNVSQKAELEALLDQVDFPNFAGDLIKNTFNAIVDSAIQQMAAYGKLLSEVATKVGEGCKSNC